MKKLWQTIKDYSWLAVLAVLWMVFGDSEEEEE